MATVVPIAILLFSEDRGGAALGGGDGSAPGATAATLSRGALVGLAALALWAVASGRVGAKKVVFTGIGVVITVIVAFAFWAQ